IPIIAALLTVSSFAAEEPIRYGGSSTIGKFITDAAAIYGKSRFRVHTRIESAGGERCVADGSCDIGGVARQVDDKWLAQGLAKTLIGRDAVAVIVNNDNRIDALSKGDLRAIFTGQLSNWSELGGPDVPITPYIVTEASATHTVFRDVILNGAEYAGATATAPDSKIVTRVASQPGAIGQISLSFLRHNSSVKPLSIDGEPASVDNPTYPISRPLYLLTRADAHARIKDFIDWVLSEEGQAIIRYRFVGVR
ncbi:MAG: phosphate ABC transporter substrate-binding protein, partial [Gammaproteobacteria bacterium]|nr:phosphate ABC transporter substrate-binding protein [Gammaproteobacteria bacterium]